MSPSTLAFLVIGLALAIALPILLLRIRIAFLDERPLANVARRLLVIAPHPDDCVIIAGGQALRTLAAGGSVRIVYLTNGGAAGEEELDRVRVAEARAAWQEAGLDPQHLVFLGYADGTGLFDPAEIREAIDRVREEVVAFTPDRVVMPLYEGGHYQHDVANLIGAVALEESNLAATLFEAPEYNPHLSWRTTPRKLIALLSRLVPFYRYTHPPEPLDQRPVWVQPLTAGELKLKQEMLRHFASQDREALVRSGGGPDRVQLYTPHDYTRPPFAYHRSLAGVADRLLPLPVLGPVVRRIVKKTRTIHPDPECRVTTLPVDEIRSA